MTCRCLRGRGACVAGRGSARAVDAFYNSTIFLRRGNPSPDQPSRNGHRDAAVRLMDGRGPPATTARPVGWTTPVPGWSETFPWLRAGTTRRAPKSSASVAADRAVPTSRPSALAPPALGFPGEWAGRRIPAESVHALNGSGPWRSVVRSRQVHGTRVRVHGSAPRGFFLAAECDGHATRAPGLLLTATLADCVPVFLADPAARAVALLHAGWRGAAGGVVESGIAAMADAFGSDPARLSVHAGPAICGRCYEVGPEVFSALGLPPPSGPALLDLRERVRRRAVSAGVPSANVTTSNECTRCGDGRYFSHRGGDQWRHLAFAGVLPREGGAAKGGLRAFRAVGLCRRCRWSRKVETHRGSVFRLCRRHQEDPSFPKYPALPVRLCRGFAARP